MRTFQFDHFYPKENYPALAMCFYNLIPCCSDCNHIKRSSAIGCNPYESDIESKTYLYPELPYDVTDLDKIDTSAFSVYFHPKDGMVENTSTLLLQERYSSYNDDVKRMMSIKQHYPIENIDSCIKMGLYKSRNHFYSTMGLSVTGRLGKLTKDIFKDSLQYLS